MGGLLKIGLASTAVILAALVAGNIWFSVMDARRADGLRFAWSEPEKALEQISERAEIAQTLSGSGKGIVIAATPPGSLGATQWAISTDGRVEGRVPERGLLVVWIPELREGRVEWRCTAEPKGAFTPSVCRTTRRFER